MGDLLQWGRSLAGLALVCALSESLLLPGKGRRQFQGLCALLLFAGCLAPLGTLLGVLDEELVPVSQPAAASASALAQADEYFLEQARGRLEALVRDKLAEAGIFPAGVVIDITVSEEVLTLGPVGLRLTAQQAPRAASALRELGLQTVVYTG